MRTRAVPHLDVNANELALVYRARGMPADEAEQRATRDAARATRPRWDTPSDRGDDHDVVGTGLGAALSSFCFFASGAAVPMHPVPVRARPSGPR